MPITGTAAGRIEIAGAATAFLVDRAADPVVTIEPLATIARCYRADLILARALADPGWPAVVVPDFIAADLVRSAGRITTGRSLTGSIDTDLIRRAAVRTTLDSIARAATFILTDPAAANLVRATRRLIIHDDAVTRVGVAGVAFAAGYVPTQILTCAGIWILVLAGRTR